ncbi:MAG TPA: cell adhesion protein [Clostridiales bacterium]|nr:cell adhesion protein [Clostridiales bacterium]
MMKNRIRRMVSLAMVFCLITTVVAFSRTASAAGTDDDITPRLSYHIISNADKPSISRGSSFEADFVFFDQNSHDPDNVQISVTSPNGSISGLPSGKMTPKKWEPDDDSSSTPSKGNAYYIHIGEKNMKYVGMGPAILKFTIVFVSEKKSCTIQKTITECQPTTTSSGTEKSDLSLASYTVSQSGIKEGEKFDLNLTLKNSGSLANHHVTVVLDGLNADEITVNGQTDTKTVDSLDAGKTTVVTFPMVCNPKMVSKNYMIKVQISSDECPTTVATNVFVPVTGTKTDTESGSSGTNASKPTIIIESYDYGGKAVLGGKEFNLAMRFRNTNPTTQIENLKITVSSVAGNDDKSVAGAFTPAKSSNTFFIDKVAPGALFSREIALLPKSDATPNSYGVNVAFHYEAVLDGKRETIESTEVISIPLTQPDRFEVGGVELPSPMFVGESGQLSISYVNKGKSKIFNLSVKLSGNFTSSEMDSYIGNVESGVGDTFQASLTPNEEGTLKGTAVFSYEDATGVNRSVTKEFSCEVSQMEDEPGEGGSEPANAPVENNGLPWYLWAGVGVGVIAILVVLRIFLKKRKAKKLRQLEEEDYYDAPEPSSQEKRL